jgi:hypothetical protein
MNVKTEDPDHPDYEAKLAKWWALGLKALEVGDGNEIEIDVDGNAIPKVADGSGDTGADMVEATANAGAGIGFCIMQLYHGFLKSRSKYAKSVKAGRLPSEVAKYDAELEASGIEYHRVTASYTCFETETWS